MDKEDARRKLQDLVRIYEKSAKEYSLKDEHDAAIQETARAEAVKTAFYTLYREPLFKTA